MEYGEESVFNMALAYLKRIDKLLYICAMSSMKGDITNWNNALRSVFRELSIRLNETERNEFEGLESDIIDRNKDFLINDKENKLILNLEKRHANFKNINLLMNNQIYQMKYRKQICFLLDEIEIKLRIKMQTKGMLLPSKDDPRRAITRR
jgi:hypothetical protein